MTVQTGFADSLEVIEEVSKGNMTITLEVYTDDDIKETYRIRVLHGTAKLEQEFADRDQAEEAMTEACEGAGIERFRAAAPADAVAELYGEWYHAFANAKGMAAQAEVQDQMIRDPRVRQHVEAIENMAPPRGWPNHAIRSACLAIKQETGAVETPETQQSLAQHTSFGMF